MGENARVLAILNQAKLQDKHIEADIKAPNLSNLELISALYSWLGTSIKIILTGKTSISVRRQGCAIPEGWKILTTEPRSEKSGERRTCSW